MSNFQVTVAVPEHIMMNGFMLLDNSLQTQARLRRIIIDEAHMSTDESHNGFRREFSLLWRLTTLPDIQVIWLLATMPPSRIPAFVDSYLARNLNVHIIRGKCARTNLSYSIEYANYIKEAAY